MYVYILCIYCLYTHHICVCVYVWWGNHMSMWFRLSMFFFLSYGIGCLPWCSHHLFLLHFPKSGDVVLFFWRDGSKPPGEHQKNTAGRWTSAKSGVCKCWLAILIFHDVHIGKLAAPSIWQFDSLWSVAVKKNYHTPRNSHLHYSIHSVIPPCWYTGGSHNGL